MRDCMSLVLKFDFLQSVNFHVLFFLSSAFGGEVCEFEALTQKGFLTLQLVSVQCCRLSDLYVEETFTLLI